VPKVGPTTAAICTLHDPARRLVRDALVACQTAQFNRAVFERLKPGASYVIIDHAAGAGAGTGDAQSLHRIDPASAREEVEAAGFVLDAESTILANKDDPHSIKVFDPSIQGETDRFAYRFVKP
jgi:predicted methyltransferase